MDKQYIAALVLRAKKNDQTAWSDLYEYSYKSLYFIAMEFMKNRTDAEDAQQEAFFKIVRNLEQLEEPEKFLAWAKQVTTNTCLNLVRKKRDFTFTEVEERAGLDDMDISLELEDVSVDFRPEEQMEIKETSRLVREMMNELPDDQRVSLDLLYGSELSVKEIAEAMECSVNTVKSRLRYGRNTIEDKVEQLRKKGTKLFALPVAAIIQILCRRELESYAAEFIPQSLLSRLKEEIDHSVVNNQSPGKSLAESGYVERKAEIHVSNSGKPAASGIPLAVKILAGVLTVAFIGTGAVFATNIVFRSNSESGLTETIQPSEEVMTAEESISEATVETAVESLPADKTENRNPNTVGGYGIPVRQIYADYNYYKQPELKKSDIEPEAERTGNKRETEKAPAKVPETSAETLPAETVSSETAEGIPGNGGSDNHQENQQPEAQTQESVQESTAAETEAQTNTSIGFQVSIGSEGAEVNDWLGNSVSEGAGGIGILQDGTRVIIDANGNAYDFNGNPLPDINISD
ncbi:MAG: RNA polymerase sigma factor [Stomatobaculum sp.]|nr:RNA polymerase sigma factor [Stomatobaculum sp.]